MIPEHPENNNPERLVDVTWGTSQHIRLKPRKSHLTCRRDDRSQREAVQVLFV